MSKIKIEYNKTYLHEGDRVEILPMSISLVYTEDNYGFVHFIASKEALMDIISIAKGQGLNISVEEE